MKNDAPKKRAKMKVKVIWKFVGLEPKFEKEFLDLKEAQNFRDSFLLEQEKYKFGFDIAPTILKPRVVDNFKKKEEPKIVVTKRQIPAATIR